MLTSIFNFILAISFVGLFFLPCVVGMFLMEEYEKMVAREKKRIIAQRKFWTVAKELDKETKGIE